VERIGRAILVLLIVGFGVTIFLIVRSSPKRIDYIPAEVGMDSVAAYEKRAGELEAESDSLARVLERVGLLQQPFVRAQLERVEQEVYALRVAVEKWKSARTTSAQGQAYRECVLLYGRASGACAVLRESEPPETPGPGK
jgi:hypothetical protein